MTPEIIQLRNELAKSNNHENGFLRGCIADLIKDKADRNLLNICLNSGVLQEFFQTISHDTFFITRCKTTLKVEFSITETAAEKAIEFCRFLIANKTEQELIDLIPNRKEDRARHSDKTNTINQNHNLLDGIGINDRFLFITQLFANSSTLFTTTIIALDKLDTIEEAVNYLKANFNWEKTETSVKFLILIKRQFSK